MHWNQAVQQASTTDWVLPPVPPPLPRILPGPPLRPYNPYLWKNCLPRNPSLVPKRLETAELKKMLGIQKSEACNCETKLNLSYSTGKTQGQNVVYGQNYPWKSSWLPWSVKYRYSISREVQLNQLLFSRECTDLHDFFPLGTRYNSWLVIKATLYELAVCSTGIAIAHTERFVGLTAVKNGGLLCHSSCRTPAHRVWWQARYPPYSDRPPLPPSIVSNSPISVTESACHDVCDPHLASRGRSLVVMLLCPENNGSSSVKLPWSQTQKFESNELWWSIREPWT